MLYPVYVHAGDAEHAHAATCPDFPGCFAAANDLADLPAEVQEAVEAHFHGEGAAAVPALTKIELLAEDEQYRGGEWVLVDIDLIRIADTPAPPPTTAKSESWVAPTWPGSGRRMRCCGRRWPRCSACGGRRTEEAPSSLSAFRA